MNQLESVLLVNQPNLKQIAIKYLEDNPLEFKLLIEQSFSDKHPINWRSAWVLAELVHKHQTFRDLIKLKASKIVSMLADFPTSGQQREYLKVLQDIELGEEDMGVLLDLCFNWLLDKKVDVAIRVHAMQIIYDYSVKEPDLQPELKAILLEEMEYGTAGFRGRAKKILSKIEKKAIKKPPQ
jgi:hypothetical protein